MNLPALTIALGFLLVAFLGTVVIVLRHLWRCSIEEAEQRGGERGFIQGQRAERKALAEHWNI